MSSRETVATFVELNEHHVCALTAHRTTSGWEIQNVLELPWENASAIAALTPEGGAPWLVRTGRQVVSLAPLASGAQKLTPDDVMRDLAIGPLASLNASVGSLVKSCDGGPWRKEDDGRWVALAIAQDDLVKRTGQVGGISEALAVSASLAQAWSIRDVLKASGAKANVAVFDLSASSSPVWLVDARGVSAIESSGVGFDEVTDAIMGAVGLKFRGAAAKLLFNERYDFTSAAADIAARLAKLFTPEATALFASRKAGAPSFHLAGLPARQNWLGEHLAKALGVDIWRPDLQPWLGSLNVHSAVPLAPSHVALVSLSVRPTGDAQHWTMARMGTISTAADVASGLSSANATPAVEAVSEPSKVAPVKAVPRAAAVPPARAAKRGGSLVAAAAEKVARSEQIHAAAQSAAPEPVAPASTGRQGRNSRRWGWVGTTVAVAAIGVLGYVYFQKVESERAAELVERAALEQRAAAAASAQLEAERAMREEEQARLRAEKVAQQQTAEAEAARFAASEQMRLVEEERTRLLHARGSVLVRTLPEGAKVTVGNLASRKSPVSISDLRLGQYTATVELDGYDPVTVRFDVRENQQADPGLITLRKRVGGLSLNSEPSGIAFDLRPSTAQFFVSSSETQQGVTPARLDGLAPGDYVVTFLREGWPRASTTVRVEDRVTANVAHRFVGGTMRFTSTPLGATVMMDGVRIGTTPCEINDLPPGELSCRFELDGMMAETIRRAVSFGEPIDVHVALQPIDRVVRIGELDVRPEPLHTVAPRLELLDSRAGKRVVISAQVNENGEPSDLRIEETPDVEAGRICAEAVSRWRFKPGQIAGRPVKTRVSIPFSMN